MDEYKLFTNKGSEHYHAFLKTQNKKYFNYIKNIIDKMIHVLKSNNSIYFAGNGGSASDSSHIASELSGRFKIKDREPLSVENLVTDINFITAISNDFSYNDIFLRAIKTKCKKGDLVIFFSTSGESKNVWNAINSSKKLGVEFILVTGEIDLDVNFQHLVIPSQNTATIQEIYMFVFHHICGVIENYFFGNEEKKLESLKSAYINGLPCLLKRYIDVEDIIKDFNYEKPEYYVLKDAKKDTYYYPGDILDIKQVNDFFIVPKDYRSNK